MMDMFVMNVYCNELYSICEFNDSHESQVTYDLYDPYNSHDLLDINELNMNYLISFFLIYDLHSFRIEFPVDLFYSY